MFTPIMGHSDDIDSKDAITAVLADCQNQLQGKAPQAGILLAGFTYDHQLILDEIQKAFPDLELIGCTTDGEMSSVLGYAEESVQLLLLHSDKHIFKSGIGLELSRNADLAGAAAIETASLDGKTPSMCITFPDGLTSSGDLVIDGLQKVLGDTLPIVGGLAGDQRNFKLTRQFYKQKVFTDSVPVLLIYGDITYAHGIASGWSPVGGKSKVTKVDNNVLYELDGTPALDTFRNYFEDHFESLHEYPLAVNDADSDETYIRSPFSYDEKSGSITFAGNIHLGATVQIMGAERSKILQGTKQAIEQSMQSYPSTSPSLILVFSCASRNEMLGTRALEELNTIRKYAGEKTPVFGFYAYGEISPLVKGQKTYFHNQTCVTVAIGD